MGRIEVRRKALAGSDALKALPNVRVARDWAARDDPNRAARRGVNVDN
jgi:hypothetical protein